MTTKKIQSMVFRIVLSLFLVLFLITKIDIKDIVIAQVEWQFLPVIVVANLCAYLMRSFFYKITLNVEKLKVRILFLITGVYNFISSIIPLGLGHLSYPYFLKKYHGIVISRGVSSLMAYNGIRVLFLIFIFLWSGVSLRLFQEIHLYFPKKILLLLFILLIVFLTVGIRYFGRDIFVGKVEEFKIEVKKALHENVKFAKMVLLIGVSIFTIVFNVISVYYSFAFISQSLSIIPVLFILSASNLSNLLPIHGPGRLGSYEAINSLCLLGLNFSGNEAIQISFAIHFLSIVIQTGIAVPCYFWMKTSIS
jgi:uncharacterized membrane protein YbhN (UPF0104 family)